MNSVFAWQGLSLVHPSEWSPVGFSGDRRQGSVDIAAPSNLRLHLWWQPAKRIDLRTGVDRYLALRAKDAGKNVPFSSKVQQKGGAFLYHFSGKWSGRGALFGSPAGDRLVILELTGGRNDSLLPIFKCAFESFQFSTASFERWALLGLDVRLPGGLRVAKQDLRAGKTHVRFEAKGVSLVAERWGFAEQLLDKHKLTDWLRAVTNFPESCSLCEDGPERVELRWERKLLPTVYAVAKVQPDLNQITVIRSETRVPEFRPQWTWLS